MTKLNLVLATILMATLAHASDSTVNALNKTGGKTANYIRVERCSDGTVAIGNDFSELTRQGVTNPCAANAAQSNGYVKNIGKTDFMVYHNVSNCSTYIGLNSIGTGFHVMYTSGNNGVCQLSDIAQEKEFTVNIQKCLLLMKNKLANEMVVQTGSLNVICESR